MLNAQVGIFNSSRCYYEFGFIKILICMNFLLTAVQFIALLYFLLVLLAESKEVIILSPILIPYFRFHMTFLREDSPLSNPSCYRYIVCLDFVTFTAILFRYIYLIRFNVPNQATFLSKTVFSSY